MSMYLAGIDEAGRGPVFGPMVMAICACASEEELRRIGAKDSKQLSAQQREALFDKIRKEFPHEIIHVSPQDIDRAVQGEHDNLNMLEARTTAALILALARKIKITAVYIDSPSATTAKYEQIVRAALLTIDDDNITKSIELRCETKADANHPIVGAASILAKVERDRAIEEIEKEHGNIGSGYPSDPATQAFLGKHWKEGHEFFRKSWSSYQRLAQGAAQPTLESFSKHENEVDAFEVLKEHGFVFEEPTNQYEVVRMRRGKTSVIKYTTGKVLVQGQEKDAALVLLQKLGLSR